MGGGTIDLGDTIRANWMIGIDRYWIICKTPEGVPSDRILGITVRSTDIDEDKTSWGARNTPYYAEVVFNGDPTN